MTPGTLVILFLIRVGQDVLIPSPPHPWTDCGKKAVETDAPFQLAGELQNLQLKQKKSEKKEEKYILYCHSKTMDFLKPD